MPSNQEIKARLAKFREGQRAAYAQLHSSAIAEKILGSLIDEPKPTFVNLCIGVVSLADFRDQDTTIKIKILDSLTNMLIADFTRKDSPLYNKFRPAGFFTIFAPTYKVPLPDVGITLHSSETFRKGLEILNEYGVKITTSALTALNKTI